MIGLGLVVLAMLGGGERALAQRPSSWTDIRCAEMPMTFEGVSRCQARSTAPGRTPAQGQSVEYLARGGPMGAANGRELILWLLWFHDDWVYRPYGAEIAESIIRSHIQPALTGGATGWSDLQSFGTTAFLTFEAKAKKCVGFDHAGPLSKPRGTDAPGHPWLLRGIVCERRAAAFEQGDVEALLRSVRLSKGGYVDAFGAKSGEAGTETAEAAPVAVAAVAAATSPRAASAAPLALSWDEVAPLASGTFTLADEGRRGGSISFVISDNGIRCTGFWKQLSGGPGTSEQPAGTWAISCPGGDAASGTWRAETSAHGSGEGRDALGRRVSIRFGG